MTSPLQVPPTEKIQHLLLDTDSRKLVKEINDLPYADIPSALLIAHRRLHAFNRFSMPPAKRLELLRPFHNAFLRFSDHYRRHFEQGAFSRELPASELDRLLDFVRELAYGFKHLTQDTLSRDKRPNGVGLILYMTLNYLHHFAMFSYNRGRMLKSSFWREVHYLYFAARALEQHRADLVSPEGQQVMIEKLYKQIILMGLCSPYALAPEEQWRGFTYVARFADNINLTGSHDPSELQECYSVSPLCEQPANIPEYQTEPPFNTRLVDLAPFVENLCRHIEAVKSGEPLRIVGMEQMQRRKALDLLLKLHSYWTRNPARKSPRQAIEEQIGLVWGLENICTMLDPLARRRESLGMQKRESSNRAWAQGENQSSEGICLRLSSDDERYPEAGQVVALIRQRGDQKILEVGLVQWCALDQFDQPFLGVERLSGRANKVAIQPQDDHSTERNGLLVIARSANGRARSVMVGPSGILKTGNRVMVISPHQAGDIYVDTLELIHRTRQVETFEVRVLQ